MKKTVVILGVALVMMTLFAAYSTVRANRLQRALASVELMHQNTLTALDKTEAKLRPLEAKRAASVKLNEDFVVEAQHVKSLAFTPTMVPGTLTGTWRASGRGYGGLGNTINQFRLADPRDGIVAASGYGADSGKFYFQVTSKGTHTFFFDNSGLLRSTPRRVFLEAEYKPD
jgi:hypothetical protein